MDFSSARDLIRWAREDIEEFDAATQLFARDGSHVSWQEHDPETGHQLVKARIPPIPDNMRKLASHALWDIKHAADHATYAAVAAVSESDPGDVHFPVSMHPNHLRSRLYKADSKYPPELRSLFESFEIYPTSDRYPGGNDEFCALSKMANTAKHAVALRAAPRSGISSFRGHGLVGGAVLYAPRPLEGPDGELTLGRFPLDPKAHFEVEIAFYIGFSDAPIFEGQPAADVLEAFAGAVTSAIDQLEAETATILASRS